MTDQKLPGNSDTMHISFGRKRKVTGNLTIHIFEDHGHQICYAPSLNISAYGDTKQEAFDRLVKDVFNDLMENLTALGPEKALNELEKLGWKRNSLFKKRFVSDSFVDKDGVLKNFNLPQETEVDTRVVSV